MELETLAREDPVPEHKAVTTVTSRSCVILGTTGCVAVAREA